MESPCLTCELRKRSKDECINLHKLCDKILEYQNILEHQKTQMNSLRFDGLYSTPSIRKGNQYYDFN